MHFAQLALVALAALHLPSLTSAQGTGKRRGAFPASTAAAQGISQPALDKLDGLIASFVHDREIVGAELMVIVNNRTIHHKGYGWRDREAKQPMVPGGVFCIRSMTKSLVGTAALMLIDEGKLALDDRAGQYLPTFERGRLRTVTVRHLLTHTSGLPLSLLVGKNLTDLEGIQAVAALATDSELESSPGTKFRYSDQGADTLAAILEIVSGQPLIDLIRQRILQPLGMRDSTCLLAMDSPLRNRVGPLYIGAANAWQRHWDPGKPPLFPFFLGSQGLYSTLEDYGRFLAFWLRNGRSRQRRLLSRERVSTALRPGSATYGQSSSGLPDAIPDYGQLMQLWLPPKTKPAIPGAATQPVAFGHSGSDGTYAWAFPAQNAIVLYFTQSRFNKTGSRVEQALGELLLDVPVGPRPDQPPLTPFLGYYAENPQSRYQAIIRDGEDLALETPGKRVRRLIYIGDDTWKFKARAGVTLKFERTAKGQVTGIRVGDHREFRLTPAADLPSVDTVIDKVRQAHGMAALEAVGPIRIRAKIELPKLGMTGTSQTLVAWPNRFWVEETMGGNFERYGFDGSRIRHTSTGQPVSEATEEQADRANVAHPLARFGDWRQWRKKLEVVQRLSPKQGDVWVVRAGDTSATAQTLYVDVTTGRLIREEVVSTLGALGRIGQSFTFSDFREIDGMVLPFRTDGTIAHPVVQSALTTVTGIDTKVTVPDATFRLEGK